MDEGEKKTAPDPIPPPMLPCHPIPAGGNGAGVRGVPPELSGLLMVTSITKQKGLDSYFAIDVETTGLSAALGDRVIEIAAVCIQNGRIISEFEQLIFSSQCISREAARIHGISKTMLDGQPLPEEVFPRFRQFVGNHVVIAHNARFDISFVRQEFLRAGLVFSNRFICTLRLARRRVPHLPNHRLETVARHLLMDLPSDLHLHRALDDARLTAQVWLALEGN